MRTRPIFTLFLLIAVFGIAACQSAEPPGELSTPAIPTEVASPTAAEQSASPHNWRGINLFLTAPLPTGPETAGVFSLTASQPPAADAAQALAARFSMQADWYADGTTLVGIDGNRRLVVRSSGEFSYYPGVHNFWVSAAARSRPPNAEEQIVEFMRNFDPQLEYAVEHSETYSGYFALPLLPGGFPLRHENFAASGLLFSFRGSELAAVDGSLIGYESLGMFEIISAEEALQRVLDPIHWYGSLDYSHSAAAPPDAWVRSYPKDEPISLSGYLRSLPAADGGAPLVSLDGYRVLGNLEGIDEQMPLTAVEAVGRFEAYSGEDVFVLESWQPRQGEGIMGSLQQDGEHVVLVGPEGQRLLMLDMPADVPLPLEQVYVMGVTVGESFEWNAFDLRFHGGGGGGGGGLGLFGLNLSGPPQALPQPDQIAEPPGEPDPQGPSAQVETVELVYFVPRYQAAEGLYIQPMWRFAGHFRSGEEFEILVQALKPEFLSPEIQFIEPPG